MNPDVAYGRSTLAPGIRSRFVADVNGLTLHCLEAGFETSGRPCLLLLHGFPELAYSWRKVMLPLAAAGYHVIAPDQRGYGLTTGWDGAYDGDLASYKPLNIVRDALGLVHALGRTHVDCVIGHDFGSPIAAWAALVRPDVFRRLVMMSAPFAGPPPLSETRAGSTSDIHADLAALDPPREHYQWYYSTRAADANMRDCPQGIHAFLRAYYHHKSADWRENQPFELSGWTAVELAKLPTYYIMQHGVGMAATVALEMPSAAEIAANRWLTDEELAVYASMYERNGFQGGLQWYRWTTMSSNPDLELFAGCTIDVPSTFIAGASDWGIHQRPGALRAMATRACTRYAGTHLIAGAGHWVQQEQPDAVVDHMMAFLKP